MVAKTTFDTHLFSVCSSRVAIGRARLISKYLRGDVRLLKVKQHLMGLVHEAAIAAELGDFVKIDFEVTEAPRLGFGDFSTNFALVAAKMLSRQPREIAMQMVEKIELLGSRHVERVEVAGAGFINFFLNNEWLYEEIRLALSSGISTYAKSDVGCGSTLLLEFVSANPTGPLHVGNGWWASYGDSLGRILSFAGYRVSTEYYVNDTGGQITALGESMLALLDGVEVAEGGYQGEYLKALARSYSGAKTATEAGKFAVGEILVMIKKSLEEIGIVFDLWYSQASIEESGAVEAVIELLEQSNAVEVVDGKKVFMATRYGDTRDRYLTKDNGDFTYLAGDIAYHYNKLVIRGFDQVIDIFGADHHGQVSSLLGALSALGIDPKRLEILLGQMVSLQQGDERVKFSKRKGNVVDLGELVNSLGSSAVRLLSLQTSIDRASVIDLEKVATKSMDNPVYYIQYAHARMAAIERMRIEREIPEPTLATVDFALLEHHRELELLRVQSRLDEVIANAAIERAPYKLVNWLKDFAGAFHGFYHDCSVLGESDEITRVRLALVRSSQVAIKVALGLLGVEAPEQM